MATHYDTYGPGDRMPSAVLNQMTADIRGLQLMYGPGGGFFGGQAVNVKSYGAIGDGVTNDTAAISARNTAGLKTYVPEGTYLTTLSQAGIVGTFYGPGQIITSDGNKRGPIVTQVNAVPTGTYPVNTNTVVSVFNADFSKVPFAIEHRVQGAASLGQPTSGYVYVPNAGPFYGYLYNSSGWNQSTSLNDGRTMLSGIRFNMAQAGNGDLVAFSTSALITGTKSGATSWLASPAAGAFAGDIQAGVAHCYLNPGELNLKDNGFDVAAFGWVVNLSRTNQTAAFDEVWGGFRSQSKGTAYIDAHFTASGNTKIGVDLSTITTDANKAAVTVRADDRLYLNAANADTTKFPNFTTVGTTYVGYTSATTSFDVVVGGTANLRVGGTTLGFYGATPAAKPTGVAVTAAGVHAALVTLGLIAA